MSRFIKLFSLIVLGVSLQGCVTSGVLSTNRSGGSCGRLLVTGVCVTVVPDLSPQVVDSGIVTIDGMVIGRLRPGVPFTFNAVSRNVGQCMAMNQSRQRGNIGMQVQVCQGGFDNQNLVIQWFKGSQVMGITTTTFFVQGGQNNRQSPHPIVISSISPLGGGNGGGGNTGGISWP